MSLIVMEHGSLSFGPQRILDDVSLAIEEGDRMGLVGANGSGKSTLLRILVGQQGLDQGQVTQLKGCRIGYLPQEISEVVHDTLLGATLAAVPGRGDLELRLEQTTQALERADDPEQQMHLAQQLADLRERLEHFERYYSEHLARRILKGLGFADEEMERQTEELSGGWRMRAALAGLLFQQPDVLFLDEPTNHLDVPSVIWFGEFLASYKNALVLICHDRDFLNRQIERVVSFEPEGLRSYRGDYESYLTQREAEEEVLEAQARNRERQLREMERFVERFRAKATKARQAQSRAKQIEKMQKEMSRPVVRPRRLSFRFPDVPRTGRDVLRLEGIHKAYGDNRLYDDLSRGVYAGDRVAIIGKNGVGKTTLLKIMARELSPDAGEVRYGANVTLGYFAQHHTEQLSAKRTVLEEVSSQCPGKGESYVRGVCGAFLFSGDDVDKPVAVLSGGERARVLLARLLVNPGNLLLMDEPTTHLDLYAAEALATALEGYGGTLVFVSHTTAFVNRLATKVWDVVDGDIVEYPGNLARYLEHQQRWQSDEARAAAGGDTTAAEAEAAETPAAGGEDAPQSRQARKARKRQEAERRNALSRRTRPLRQAIEKTEQQISRLEQQRAELEPQLADPEVHADKARYLKLLKRYESSGKELEQLYWRWEERSKELEQVEAELGRELG